MRLDFGGLRWILLGYNRAGCGGSFAIYIARFGGLVGVEVCLLVVLALGLFWARQGWSKDAENSMLLRN